MPLQNVLIQNCTLSFFSCYSLFQAYCAELSCFDYHRMCKGSGNLETTFTQCLLPDIQDFRKMHGFYVSSSGHPSKQQTATIRTNCLDCLDRTNSVQGFLGQQVSMLWCVCGGYF